MGTLDITRGAKVAATTGGAGEIDVAAQAGAVGAVTVDGAGSSLSGQSIFVGGTGSAAGGSGRLTISNGGVVSVSDATVTESGVVTLAGGALAAEPLTIDSGGAISGFGTLTGDIANNGVVTASGGLLDIAGAVDGALAIAQGASLELDKGAAGATIQFAAGGGETLVIGDPGAFAAASASLVAGFQASRADRQHRRRQRIVAEWRGRLYRGCRRADRQQRAARAEQHCGRTLSLQWRLRHDNRRADEHRHAGRRSRGRRSSTSAGSTIPQPARST
jgi:T5SS/PEP-CTERM-associated repeat protein